MGLAGASSAPGEADDGIAHTGQGTPAPEKSWDLKPKDLSPESTDPLLAALMVLCRLHGRTRSGASLTAGLPLDNGKLTLELLPRAAQRAHLSVRLVRRSLRDLSSHVFPVALLLKGRTTCVVVRAVGKGRLEIILPETGAGSEIVSRKDLEARYEGYAILARPEITYRGETENTQPRRGHWFWSTLLRMGRVYFFVIIAAIMVNLFAIAGPLFTMNVYDRVVPNQALETLWVLAVGISIVYVFDFILRLIRSYLIDHSGKRADVVMSSYIFSHAMNVRMSARPDSSGAFANKLKEFEAVREFFTSATVVAVVDIPFIFLFIAVVYMIAGPAAYVPAIAVPVVIIGGLLLQAPLRHAVRKSTERGAQKHGILVEAIGALDTIKSLGAEGRMLRDWETYSGESASLGARVKFLSSLAVHFSAYVQQVVTVGVVIVGVYQIANKDMTMGGLIAATILTGRIMAPLGQVAGLVGRLHHAASARKSINEIMALPVDRPHGKQFLSRPALAGRIDFQAVSFSYPNTQTPAVRDVTFHVEPGERIAIVGPVGSGKSTIARLMTRLYDSAEGSIQIDGTDIQQIDPADIRRTAGVVLQDVVLFTGTVRENIAMSAPEADDSMIIRAAQLAGAHEFISRHPQGYDMPVGERGAKLSGGQRQAVALARALLPDPPILVMDEPTSMMDIPSEQAFVGRLRNALKDKALIFITHRPSLLEIADRIIVLQRGSILTQGPASEIRPRLKMSHAPWEAPAASSAATGGGADTGTGAKTGATPTRKPRPVPPRTGADQTDAVSSRVTAPPRSAALRRTPPQGAGGSTERAAPPPADRDRRPVPSEEGSGQ
jgi:ATP-binding cassette subfamily C protein LapB